MAFSQVGHHCKTSAELLQQRQGVAACSRSCPFHGEVMCPGGSSKRWAVASVGEAPHIVCEPNLDVLACGGAAIEHRPQKSSAEASRSIGERRGPDRLAGEPRSPASKFPRAQRPQYRGGSGPDSRNPPAGGGRGLRSHDSDSRGIGGCPCPTRDYHSSA